MAKWHIDPAHSEVKFKVKHLVVSTVTGNFKNFEAVIQGEKNDFTDAQISFEADVNSLSTNNEQRDTHLKSPDFFDAAKHPKLTFRSSSVTPVTDEKLEVRGELTIKGITRPITLAVAYNGTVSGFGGQQVAGFEITGKINRFDYGLTWNAITEAGGVVVSSDVKLEISAEFNLAQEVAKAA
jgi:polyisoprenoid-binding protein YceI